MPGKYSVKKVNIVMEKRMLVTLGPTSMSEMVVRRMTEVGVSLFRVNLSHTPLANVESTIRKIQQWTDRPICLDSEGAQVRNQRMVDDSVVLVEGKYIKIHFTEVLGDSVNISFSPSFVAQELVVGDVITVDFNAACLRVIEIKRDCLVAVVEHGGGVGSNKAVDVDRRIELDPITKKDMEAFKIGKRMGINNFALSFANRRDDVEKMRNLVGDACIISKIESRAGVRNLKGILEATDQILIDRGDLSRQIPIEKIPFLQRRIISFARSRSVPVFVATNLLESMILTSSPTRAEVNDVVSTLLMGADGLVLAAETAIGKFPLDSVVMVRKLIDQTRKWTPNTSIEEIVNS